MVLSCYLKYNIFLNRSVNTHSLGKTENSNGFFFTMNSRRSNSICKSPVSSPKDHPFLARDISRSESLRASSSSSHRIFRPCDLIHGEVLGKGFFGQAIKVCPLFIFGERFESRLALFRCQGDSVGVKSGTVLDVSTAKEPVFSRQKKMLLLEPRTGEVRGLASFCQDGNKQLFITLERKKK